jgi:DNA-binding transcriptional regulator YiaG
MIMSKDIKAARIKAARIRLKESQTAFAARFGVDQATIHRWETEGLPRRGPARKAVESVLKELQPFEASK